MTPRESQIDDELRRIDPHLAGLFRQGIENRDRVHEPGGIYMLSHAGRELSAAIIRLLANEGDPISEEEEARVPTDEQHRRTISQALGLGVHHPSVTTWMRTHKALQETAHYRRKAPSAESVQRTIDALRVLTDILFGRIGLYFDAREEVDALLLIDAPAPADVERLRALALRPELRRTFFHELRHVGWLEPLRNTNLFKEPPDLIVDPDTGDHRAPPWPEGEYLVHIAGAAPERVAEVLLEVPDANRNPQVWSAVADAALRMPAASAVRLVPKLAQSLDRTEHPAVSRSVFAVAKHLTAGEEGDAISLLRALLKVDAAGEPRLLHATPTGESATLPRMRHTARPRELLNLVQAIGSLRPREIVPELSNRLNRMLQIEYGDPEGRDLPVPDYSRSARGSLEEETDRSPLALMAAAVQRAARTASAHTDPGPARVLARLARYPWHVFVRLRLAFLADVPVFDQTALDAAIGDLDLLDTQPVLTEYRQLIRAHFAEASPTVRDAVVQHILRGPAPAHVERVVKFYGDEDAEGVAQAFRDRWQCHLLRLFGATPPPELEGLARQLGTIDEDLSRYERDMDEHGYAVEGGVWSGPESPISLDELRGMSSAEVVEYLRGFTPKPDRDAPTPAGLASVLTAMVREDPAGAAPLLARISAEGVDPTYIRGLLQGLAAAAREGKQLPWSESLALTRDVAARPPEPAPHDPAGHYIDHSDPGVAWARREAADLLSECARNDLVPVAHRDELWSAVGALVSADTTWESGQGHVGSMDDVLFQALNHLSGKATEALLDVALYDYRIWQKAGSAGTWDGSQQLRRFLGTALERSDGDAAVAVRCMIGTYLPPLVVVDRAWVEENWEMLFGGATQTPLENPMFSSYVVQGRLHKETFEVLRPLYHAAVLETSRESNQWTAGKESFRPGRYLLADLLYANQAGWLGIDDDAELLDHVFTHAQTSDVAHVWWSVYRGWEESSDPVSEDLVRRVLDLANWRLGRLEGAPVTERRRQEAAGIAWLAMVEALSDADALQLLLRTVRISAGEVPVAGALWERIGRMAVLDARAAGEIATSIIESELKGEFPYFNFAEIAPVLRAALQSGDPEARTTAQRTIHTLGERGFEQFGELLREAEGDGPAASGQA